MNSRLSPLPLVSCPECCRPCFQVVLNNFSEDDRKLKLTASMFQNMFPAINLKEVKLSDTRRVLLFNYDKETDRIDFRHYMIRVLPIGMSKR